MKAEIITKLFDLFITKTDDLRPYLATPFRQNGIICASDANSLIYTNAENGCGIKIEVRGNPDISQIIERNANYSHSFSASALRNNLKVIMIPELDDIEVKCIKCDGEGELHCDECEHNYDCPECDGSGKISLKKETGYEIIDINLPQLFNGVLFKYKFLDRLCRAADIIGIDTVIWVARHPDKANFFIIGDFNVLLMPMIQSDNQYHTIDL